MDTLKAYLAEIRYQIADRLFSRDLDDAFNMGIREGQRRYAYAVLSGIKKMMEDAPKNQHPGLKAFYDKIQEEN
jgi:hypothetical protein